METFTVPIAVVLVMGLVLTTGFHVVYKANANGRGIVEIAPWRQRLWAAIAPVTGWGAAFAALFRTRQQLIAATLALALCLAHPSADTFAGLAIVGVAGTLTIESMQGDLDALSNQVRAIIVAANGRAMTAAERGDVESLVQKGKSIRSRLDRVRGDLAMTAELDRITGGMATTGTRSPSRGGGSSIGQQIMDSEMGRWLQANRGKFPSGKWQSPSSEILAATLTSDPASGGDLTVIDYREGILPLPTRALVVADLIAPGTTDSNSVGYMKETTATNAAATVAEGVAKPESTLIFEAVTDPVRKIATWIPVTEEMLDDVPTLRGYLDVRLRHFVQLAEDDQLLNGDGTAPNISGIRDRAGLTASMARVAQSNPDVILQQISAVEQATSMAVDGIVMHPTNWDSILLLKDADGNYIAGGGPFALPGRKTLWGRDVAVTPAMTLNSALVGAFRTAPQFFRRGGLRVEASNSHASFFVENKVAIRAEERGALAVYRESAFGMVTNLT